MKTHTPMIRQYLDIKKDHEDALLFYRLGDFYELFFDDAKVAAEELGLVLTARGKSADAIPMCGVPHHASASYIYRLAQKGYRIAIVEQLEDPAEAEGIVKRGVVKIVTPGTIMDELSDNSEAIYMASVYDFAYGYSVAIVEMASGKVITFTLDHDDEKLISSLLNYNIKEIVLITDTNAALKRELSFVSDILVSEIAGVSDTKAYSHLFEHLDNKYLVAAVEILLSYLSETQLKLLNHLRKVEEIRNDGYLKIDYNSIANLELVESLRGGSVKNSLLDFLDHSKTSMGKRTLRSYITRPLINRADILKRQAQITDLRNDYILYDDLEESLKAIYDLERLNAKISYGNANPLDLIRIQKSLNAVPKLLANLIGLSNFSDLIDIDPLTDLAGLIESAISEDAKVNIREGNIFKDGYNSDLDHARSIQKHGQNWIVQLEADEREKTGISTLKVGYNRVFGYFIEVSKANIDKIKDEFNYVRKQTLTNSERYVTEELKSKEEEILNADEIAKALEYSLYNDLINQIATYSSKILALSDVIGQIDFLFSLATVARFKGYSLPEISSDRSFVINDGRHPILETIMRDKDYVANKLDMSNEDIWVITGPNMGGKSTFMRQSVLIVIMAQMGSYIPATFAKIPIFDQIFTRIGASDDILSGKSTFMVEMAEANDALSNATENSLIIFDEIGRGTSTYDGMALAKSMIEYIALNIKAKTLFSTHYHELVSLAERFENVSNYHLLVKEEAGEISLQYQVVPGVSNKSYGINVAKLAGLPNNVLLRASEILDGLEASEVVHSGAEVIYKDVEVIPNNLNRISSILSKTNLNEITPMMAMQLLDDLLKELNEDE
ncbi:MAG: DNA mismatch repair protein MutS [Erysipelothrix sp.]|nr:DNA mismatch repair protein MutS [Erysipelothrix sp.]